MVTIPPIKMLMTGDGLWHCFTHINKLSPIKKKETSLGGKDHSPIAFHFTTFYDIPLVQWRGTDYVNAATIH